MKRHIAAVKLIARDGRIPRWLRALLVFGALPVPGPFDDVVLVIAVGLLWVLHRDKIRDAYGLVSVVPVVPLDTWGAWS